MWAQKWGNIYPLVEPFPNAGARPDAGPELQKLTVRQMYDLGE